MTTVREELIELNGTVSGLALVAEDHREISGEYLGRITDLDDRLSGLMESAEVTADRIAQLRSEVIALRQDLITAIATASMIHHEGQVEQTKAIKSLGGDIIGGLVAGGLFAMFGAAANAAATLKAGEEISRAIRESARPQQRFKGPKGECWTCGGTGVFQATGKECRKCRGTGKYSPKKGSE